MAEGLRQRHGNRCTRPASGCKCPWEAWVYSAADEGKIRKAFADKATAKAWRQDALGQVRRKELRAPKPTTLDQAANEWLEGAKAGLIRTRSGDAYKPAAIRSYESTLRLRVRPELGHRKLADIDRHDIQQFVNQMMVDKLHASTIATTINPLRAIYRQALKRPDSGITINPTTGLDLPKVESAERRIAPPAEAVKLLATLNGPQRVLYATGFYAGLRRGELQALRVENIDLGSNLIHVQYGWDPKAGEIPTKNRERRRVPIVPVLHDYLDQHLLDLAWRDQPDGLVFGREPRKAFAPSSNEQKAKRGWGWSLTSNPEGDGPKRIWTPVRDDALAPIDMHELRHTYASIMIAAGVNIKALSTFMGHKTVAITQDLYGHLLPGAEDEAAALLDAFLARADTAARLAQISETGANAGASN